MRFSLQQFREVFNLRGHNGKPYILIGGQAVNFWAETYLEAEPELHRFLPFVSKDIDFLGGRDDVLATASTLGLPARLPHKKMMTAFSGAVPFRVGNESASVEFIRRVPGISWKQAESFSVLVQREGQAIRVLDCISLLVCKVDLALTVNQTERRDIDHLHILLICVRAFLRDLLQLAAADPLQARNWLKTVERVLKLAESTAGRKATRKFGVDWQQALPEKEIAASNQRLFISFREKRLSRWRIMAKSTRKS